MAEEKTTEVEDLRRKFEFDGEMYYIATPTAEDIRGADWQYSKTYTKSLVEGITTSAEMMDILMRRGIIGPEFDQRRRELSDDLAEKVIQLQTAHEVDEKQALAIQVATAREELFNWNQRLNGPMSNTCEQMSDDARLEYLTSRMIERKDGSKLWDSYDDFLKEKSQGLAVRSRFEIMLYLQGMDSNFIEQTPEAVAMREVEDELKVQANRAIEELSKQQAEEDAKASEDSEKSDKELEEQDEESKDDKEKEEEEKKPKTSKSTSKKSSTKKTTTGRKTTKKKSE